MNDLATAPAGPRASRAQATPTGRRAPQRLTVLAILAALLLTVLTPGVVAASDDGGYWAPSTYSSKDESQLVTLTNQARAAKGLNPLIVDSALTSMARWRSKDMADRNYFSHSIPPSGKTVFDYLTASGYCYKVAGENIGTNTFPDDVATATIEQGFLGSPGHYANIVGTWQVIGIGAWEGADGAHFWTVLFAVKCSAPAPAPKATPRPTAKPVPKPVATVKPTLKPTLKPTPVPTIEATPFVSDPPSPEPTVDPFATPYTILASEPPDDPGGNPAHGRDLGLQVVDPPAAHGLVETIVGDVTARFFGH